MLERARFLLPLVFLSQFSMSGIRQNYNEACEAAINKQINMELYAGYVYQSMVSFAFFLIYNFYRRGMKNIM